VARGGATIYVRLEGVIDFTRETERLGKDLGKVSKELSSLVRKLQNQDFLSKAPADVVAKVRDQQLELLEKQQKLQTTLDKIRAYDSAS
jgi:valyl-tRNA synthetase